jgi:hypothetical protein
MANVTQFTFSTPIVSHIKYRNFKLGVKDQDYGPTSRTGFYMGGSTPSGGYIVALDKPSDGPSYYVFANDTDLLGYLRSTNPIYANADLNIILTNLFGSTSSNTGLTIQNMTYENIETDNMVLSYDFGFLMSYISSTANQVYNIAQTATPNQEWVNKASTSYSYDYGGYSYFDGIDDYIGSIILYNVPPIVINQNLFLTGDCTFEFFLRKKDINKLQIYLDISPIGIGRMGVNASNNLFFTYGNGTLSQTISGNLTIGQNQWYHLCVVRDLSGRYQGSPKVTLYVNGVQDISVTADYTNVGPPYIQNMYFFRSDDGSYTEVDCAIIRLYNQALSSAQVLQNFNAQKSRFGL